MRAEIASTLHNTEFNARSAEQWMQAIQDQGGWRVLYDVHGVLFSSFEAFCAAPQPHGLGAPQNPHR